MLGQILDGDAVGLEAAGGAHILVLLAVPLGEAPLLRDVDLEWEKEPIKTMPETNGNVTTLS